MSGDREQVDSLTSLLVSRFYHQLVSQRLSGEIYKIPTSYMLIFYTLISSRYVLKYNYR